MSGSTLNSGKGFTKPRKPMNPGKGFQNRGGGFQRHDNRDEVGEGEGSSFGYSKKQQARGAAMHDEVGEGVTGFGMCKKSQTATFGKPSDMTGEVGEGVTGSFGLSKSAQTRNAGKFQDEVGEGLVKGFGKRTRAVVAAYNEDRVRKVPTLDDAERFKWGEEVGEGAVSLPKVKHLSNQAVMDSARGRPCLLQAPYTMHHDPATTVACHGNWSTMGKGAHRKADDCYIVWGCYECHAWLDQGPATAEEKQRVHALGMFRQMLAWEAMAVSDVEPLKFRNAARWALDHLEAAEYDPRTVLMELESAQASATDGGLELDKETGLYLPVRAD